MTTLQAPQTMRAASRASQPPLPAAPRPQQRACAGRRMPFVPAAAAACAEVALLEAPAAVKQVTEQQLPCLPGVAELVAQHAAAAAAQQAAESGATAQASVFAAGDFHQLFTLGEVLGQGSYGTVRACTCEASGAQYAVKILAKRKGAEERSDVILREVKLWSMLSGCRHVARLVGVWQDGSNIFIVQELLAGGDLQALLDAQGTLSEAEAASAMRCVMSALAAAHEAGICYGDVKPANFMLSNAYPAIAHLLDPSKPKGELAVKAVDFGCAQWCPDGCALLQGLSGTPVFMAPEVISDHRFSLAMDVWAAGVMLYQLLTARFPFWDCDVAGLGRIHPRQILKDIQNGSVLLDTPATAQLSAGERSLLAAMLTKDPAARISAAGALAHPWLAAGAAADAPGEQQ